MLHPVFLWGFALIIILSMGSFISMLAFRYPKCLLKDWQEQCQTFLNEHPEPLDAPFNLAWPGSFCPQCKHSIAWYDNVPLLGFLWQAGHCRHCRQAISWRYPIIESLCLISSLIVLWFFGLAWLTIPALLLTWCLLAIATIDLDYQLIPDPLSLGLLWLGLAVNSFDLFTSLNQAVWGALVGYSSLWLIMRVYALLTGKIGMGHGDFKLFAALGAWMGLTALIPIILAASVLGSIVGITLLIAKRTTLGNPLPFGPFLAIAGWLVFICFSRIHIGFLGL